MQQRFHSSQRWKYAIVDHMVSTYIHLTCLFYICMCKCYEVSKIIFDGTIKIVHTALWYHSPNKMSYIDCQYRLYNKSASLVRCNSKQFRSIGMAAAKAVSPKLLWVHVTTHARLSVEHSHRSQASAARQQMWSYSLWCLYVQYVQIIKVHISASVVRLLESAEQMELKKAYHDGTLRELCIDDIANFKDSGTFFRVLVFFLLLLILSTNACWWGYHNNNIYYSCRETAIVEHIIIIIERFNVA